MQSPEKVAVDDFVKQKVLPEYRDIVAELRRLMRECAPDAKEILSYGVPMYRQRRTPGPYPEPAGQSAAYQEPPPLLPMPPPEDPLEKPESPEEELPADELPDQVLLDALGGT
jgi:hypothetical protein